MGEVVVPVVDARRRVGVDPHGPRMVEQLRVCGCVRRGGGLGPRHPDTFDASVTKVQGKQTTWRCGGGEIHDPREENK